jgi:hypothetical protein
VKDTTLKVLDRIGNAMFDMRDFLRLNSELMTTITSRSSFRCKEDKLFHACVKWADARIPDKDVNGKTLRQKLSPFIHNIRFPCMSKEEFRKIKALDILNSDEVVDVLMNFVYTDYKGLFIRDKRNLDDDSDDEAPENNSSSTVTSSPSTTTSSPNAMVDEAVASFHGDKRLQTEPLQDQTSAAGGHENRKDLIELLANYCDESSDGQVVHIIVNCDACNVNPIRGIRYKCEQCDPSYDLCHLCEPNRHILHDKDHTFEEIRKPQLTLQGLLLKLLKKSMN